MTLWEQMALFDAMDLDVGPRDREIALAALARTCEHDWPADLDRYARCQTCGLPYAEWSQ
jgi:hypothetical protein